MKNEERFFSTLFLKRSPEETLVGMLYECWVFDFILFGLIFFWGIGLV